MTAMTRGLEPESLNVRDSNDGGGWVALRDGLATDRPSSPS